MSFSAPNAYGIKRLSARIASFGDIYGTSRWLEILFVDKYTGRADSMAVHFPSESADQFNMLVEAITHIFDENRTKEEISEV